ncbi:hypothetical protein ACFW5D_25135 [Streptomyces sp. NPDC058770]
MPVGHARGADGSAQGGRCREDRLVAGEGPSYSAQRGYGGQQVAQSQRP